MIARPDLDAYLRETYPAHDAETRAALLRAFVAWQERSGRPANAEELRAWLAGPTDD